MNYPHLTSKTAEKMSLSIDERIQHIRKPRWIGYSQAQTILNKLEDLLNYPSQERMPNMLLVGETNNGKTVLVNKFRQRHPPDDNARGEALILPVLYIQASPGPDENGLYTALLSQLFEPSRRSESLATKRDRIINILHRIDLGMIMIDEVQHILSGSYTKQRNYLNALKYLGNELRVPIVGIGTAEAIRAIQTDPQLANRFIPEVLPKWKLDQEYLRLLSSFESLLPLAQASSLTSPDIAQLILQKSSGTLGEISTLINSAAIYALKNGKENITTEAIKQCGYLSPEERKYAAAKL